ncbi:unnamed protein product [Scytosiphon promiscuus]
MVCQASFPRVDGLRRTHLRPHPGRLMSLDSITPYPAVYVKRGFKRGFVCRFPALQETRVRVFSRDGRCGGVACRARPAETLFFVVLSVVFPCSNLVRIPTAWNVCLCSSSAMRGGSSSYLFVGGRKGGALDHSSVGISQEGRSGYSCGCHQLVMETKLRMVTVTAVHCR